MVASKFCLAIGSSEGGRRGGASGLNIDNEAQPAYVVSVPSRSSLGTPVQALQQFSDRGHVDRAKADPSHA